MPCSLVLKRTSLGCGAFCCAELAEKGACRLSELDKTYKQFVARQAKEVESLFIFLPVVPLRFVLSAVSAARPSLKAGDM